MKGIRFGLICMEFIRIDKYESLAYKF